MEYNAAVSEVFKFAKDARENSPDNYIALVVMAHEINPPSAAQLMPEIGKYKRKAYKEAVNRLQEVLADDRTEIEELKPYAIKAIEFIRENYLSRKLLHFKRRLNGG